MTKPYEEGFESTASSEGKEYRLDILFRIVQYRKRTVFKVKDLIWVLPHTTVDEDRVQAADVAMPILVYRSKKYGLVTLDGAHRLTKANREGKESIAGYLLMDSDLKKAEIKHIAVESAPLYTKW